MKNERMQAQEFVSVVENALKDEFVATITRKENEIQVQLLNGQAFTIKIEEV